MTDRGLSRLLDYLRRSAPSGPDLTSDGVLLGKYADARDEAAFELLARRHGSLVWSAVRRIVRDEHVAEDALQATFLALARKANSLRGSNSVASWLYRVAVRIAVRARPKPMPTLTSAEVEDDPALAIERDELISVVDEEVNRLPERLRQAIVLCCFSGHSAEEAAQRLGCPRGTILSRLHAAREKLRQQLARRGFEAAALGPLLAECGPTPLSASLIAIAVRAAGPTAALSPIAITLARGALSAMLMTKVKVTAIALVAAAGLGLSATHWNNVIARDPSSTPPKSVAAKEPPARMVAMQQPQFQVDNDATKHLQKMADERNFQEMSRQEEQKRLATAEAKLWDVIHIEQDRRQKMHDELANALGSSTTSNELQVKLAAIDAVTKKYLEQLYETKPLESEEIIKKGFYKPGEHAYKIDIAEAVLKQVAKEREGVLALLAERDRKRAQYEREIKNSELREQLELEKYRKLLK